MNRFKKLAVTLALSLVPALAAAAAAPAAPTALADGACPPAKTPAELAAVILKLKPFSSHTRLLSQPGFMRLCLAEKAGPVSQTSLDKANADPDLAKLRHQSQIALNEKARAMMRGPGGTPPVAAAPQPPRSVPAAKRRSAPIVRGPVPAPRRAASPKIVVRDVRPVRHTVLGSPDFGTFIGMHDRPRNGLTIGPDGKLVIIREPYRGFNPQIGRFDGCGPTPISGVHAPTPKCRKPPVEPQEPAYRPQPGWAKSRGEI